jgi:hypothetical protein
MEALATLREFAMAGALDQVAEAPGGALDFGGRAAFPAGAPTPLLSQRGQGAPYTLGALVGFLRARAAGVKYLDYFRDAKARGAQQVMPLDRQDLEDYLSGKRDAIEGLAAGGGVGGAPGAPGAEDAAPDVEGGEEGARAKRARRDAGGGAGAAGAAAAEPLAGEAAALRGVLANERRLRDADSVLCIPGRSFADAAAVFDRAAGEGARLGRARDRRAAGGARAAPAPPQRSGRYERETAPDAALRQAGAGSLGLAQVGFADAAEPAGAPPAAPPAAAPAAAPAPRAPPPRARPPPGGAAAAPPPRRGTPIILVPPAASAFLSMLNARAFLEEGRYVPPCDAGAAAAPGAPRPAYVSVFRRAGRAPPPGDPRPDKWPGVKYHVTDREPARREDWVRVVAVVVLGKPWQFKTWPFKGAAAGDLLDTFSRVAGVYLHFADEPVPAAVKAWDVKAVALPRHARGEDARAAAALWAHVDAFLEARGSRLAY